MARQSESVRKQQSVIRGDKLEIAMESSINVVNRDKANFSQSGVKGSKGKQPMQKNQRESLQYKFCTRCGKSPIHDLKDCPAREAICHKCSRRGHFKRYCRSAARVQEIHQESSGDSSDDTTETFIGIVDTYQETPDWTVNVIMNDHPVEFSIDTGADMTMIPEHIYQQAAGSISLQPTSRRLCGPSQYAFIISPWKSCSKTEER